MTGILDDALQARSTQDWLALLCGVAPVRTPREALMDGETHLNGRIDTLTLASGARFDVLASPLAAGEGSDPEPCPAMGAYTDETLAASGFSALEIKALRARGVI